MSDSWSDSQRNSSWERLARYLSSDDGCEAVMLLRQSGLVGTDEDFEMAEHYPGYLEKPNLPRAVGPWIPRTNGDTIEFARESEWDKYLWLEERDVLTANRDESVYRVCLVGESVASGMFFAPKITPAKVLQSLLSQVRPVGSESVETIDLTRNAMRLPMLIDIVDAAAQLEPDLIIVFAGNNFCRDYTVGRSDQSVAPNHYVRAANEGGPVELVREFTRQLTRATRASVEKLARNAKMNGSNLMWLIPAVSSSWQRFAPVPWLDLDGSKRWHHLLKEAKRALAEKEFEKARELGRAMLDLDQGACPTSQQIMASALEGSGHFEAAARRYEQALNADCALQRTSFLAPGIQPCVRETLFEEFARQGLPAIDLGTLFSQHVDEHETTDSLFVDYCHLSVKGMHVAMTAVATEILRLTGSETASDAKQSPPDLEPFDVDSKVVARGLFEAAIYTSHLGYELCFDGNSSSLRERFRAALDQSSDLAEVMSDYVRLRHGSAVPELSRSTHRIVATANSLLDFGILQWIQGVDSQTIEALCGVLEEAGHDGAALLAHYQEHDKRQLASGVDISEPRYLKHFSRDGKIDWDPERGTRKTQPFLVSYWPDLPLVLAADRGAILECCLTIRLPGHDAARRNDEVRVSVNGMLATTINASETWSRHQFVVGTDFTTDGFNDILLEWPELSSHDGSAVEEAVGRYQSFGQANWYPVFGEVFSFQVKSRAES